jgi:sarcosine oxidase
MTSTDQSDKRYDVIVVGVGGMGSAATYHLSKRGKRVLALEKYDIPHTRGSSHGNSRIIRLVQNERPAYVPLIQRAFELWRKLQDEHDEQLLYKTGSIHASPSEGNVFKSARRACQNHSIKHDVLTGKELGQRFPAYKHIPTDFRAVYQPDGGFLVPEECIIAHVNQAHANGADIRAREPVQNWQPTEEGVVVRTNKGKYEADNLVFAVGAWTPKFVEQLNKILVPERRVMAWLQPTKPNHFKKENFPVFSLETGNGHYYGFPMFDVPGFKFGRVPPLPRVVDPDEMSREPTIQEEELHREFAKEYFPTGAGPTMRLVTCLVTFTDDGDFIIDTHPDFSQVAIAAGFSGNGFKFCSVIGEIMADIIIKGNSELALDQFAISRF